MQYGKNDMNDYYSDISKAVEMRNKKDKRNYIALLNAGVTAQEEKLRQNEHKRGFDNVDLKYAFNRIREELSELSEALFGFDVRSSNIEDVDLLENIDYSNTRYEFADIGNFSNMGVYKCDQELNNAK